MSLSLLAVLLGGITGLSLVATAAALPPLRRRSLADRIAPFVRHAAPASTLLEAPPSPRTGVRGLLLEQGAAVARWFSGRLGSSSELQRRLQRLGTGETVEHYRSRQLILTVTGLAGGAFLGIALGSWHGQTAALMAAMLLIGGTAGFCFADWWLSMRIRRREERILAEFPTIAELLALSITAGESTSAALERVASASSGELADELRRALAQSRTGSSLTEALDSLAKRLAMDAITQFVDGVVVAVSRGSPLAEVLRAQAADARDASRRRLMEQGGKKEVGMLVPVVLGVLPITVLFAIFPSFALLDL